MSGASSGSGPKCFRHWLSIALLTGCIVAALAACGSSAAHGYHNPKYPYGAPNVPFSTSKCLRENGVSGFPDPREGPDGGGVGFPGGFGIGGEDELLVMGQTFSGPAVKHAIQVCKEYMPPGGPGPTLSEAQRVAALNYAACMRDHGLANFPDPTFSGPNQRLNLGPGLNPQSPAFERAAKACGLNRP
jgi:hypothetical protein